MGAMGGMGGDAGFRHETQDLHDDHAWEVPPGLVVAVIDRGAVRFNVPRGWIPVPDTDALKFHDAHPPDDSCTLGASYLKLPPRIDWSALPLSGLLCTAARGAPGRRQQGPAAVVERSDLELAWAEYSFEDANEHREARTRIAVARGADLQALITLDYWPEDAERLEPVWSEVLRSLELGRYVRVATRGDVEA
jgi:hypothetical protein